MWCKDTNCSHYDIKNDKCLRVGEDDVNTGEVGVCWMAETEYQHGFSKEE